ncbi:hypothetical protein SAMIE_2000790 (plasmid) [Sphingobium amiense]|jgi:hypothetical protein|uniref:XRE family transcriptional regulator n=2 Tax=Sphingobium TaxID=165695 RepID=A0A494WGM4_9SPHN|nr:MULTISPECIES: hypothetical protein [Sphingobium]QJR06047.1 hypothetical protein HH800_27790 [Sphingobium yanoikuyae]BBE00193.1 hypothetical protein SAMIE_2000790 [Sphingobium amiense]
MTSLATSGAPSSTDESKSAEENAAIPFRDYIPYILQAMSDQNVSVRKLALKTGIRRNRLSNLLRPTADPSTRESMTLVEFQTILHVLQIGFIQAVLGVETLRDLDLLHDGRFSTMMQMISEVFASLPLSLVHALNDVEGMDGTEIRREWAGPLRDGVVDRVVREVIAIIERRARMEQSFRLD